MSLYHTASDDAYDRLLCDVSRSSRDLTLRILKTLCASCRPLTFQEMAGICAVNTEHPQHYDPKRRPRNPDDLLAICPDLIHFETVEKELENGALVDVQLIVRPIDTLLPEYLQSERIRQRPTSRFAIESRQANTEIAQICLTFLTESSLATAPLTETILEQLPFARYAAQYWYRHYCKAVQSDKEILSLLERLFITTSQAFPNWIRLCDLDGKHDNAVSLDRSDDNMPSPTYYASLLGLDATLTKLTEQINSPSENAGASARLKGTYGTPLQTACAEGHLEAVKILLAAGVDVNQKGGKFQTALNAATCKGYERIVQILLDGGADVATKLDKGETALHWAAFYSFDIIIHLLLHRETESLLQDNEGRTPLHWAVAQSNHGASEILARHNKGIYLQSRDIYGWTPFYLAVRRCEWVDNLFDATELVSMLLECGSDVNACSDCGKTVLHEVAAYGQVDTAQHVQKQKKGPVSFSGRRLQLTELLLQGGNDVEIHDNSDRTASDIATEMGNRDVADRLTQKENPALPDNGYVPEWSSLRPFISEILLFPHAKRNVSQFMGLYNLAHRYCLSDCSELIGENPQVRKNRSGDFPMAKHMYFGLRDHVHEHVQDLVCSLATVEPKNMLQHYLSEWDKFSAASKKISHVFRYMDRHLVLRMMDEGHRRFFPTQDMFFTIWKQQVILSQNQLPLTNLILEAIDERLDHDRTPSSLNTSLLDSIVEVIWSGNLSVSQLLSSMSSKSKDARKTALLTLLEWSTDFKFLTCLNLEAIKDWPVPHGFDILLDLLSSEKKITGKGEQGCDVARAIILTSYSGSGEHQLKILQKDAQMIASKFDEHALNLLINRRGNEIVVDANVARAAATNTTYGLAVMRGLLQRYGNKVAITEDVVKAAVENRESGLQLLTLLFDFPNQDFQLSETILEQAARNGNFGFDLISMLLDQRRKEFIVTEKVLKAAAFNDFDGQKLMTLFLNKFGDDVVITQDVAKAAISNRRLGFTLTKMLLEKRGNDFVVTSELIKAVPQHYSFEKRLKDLLSDKLEATKTS